MKQRECFECGALVIPQRQLISYEAASELSL